MCCSRRGSCDYAWLRTGAGVAVDADRGVYLVIVGTALALVLAAWGLMFLLGARATAVLAALGYRLVSYWLPLPVGAGAYLRIKSKGSPR